MIKKFLTLFYAFLAALISSGIVLGAISLSLVESGSELNLTPPDIQAAPFNPFQGIIPQVPSSVKPELACAAPPGWLPYTLQASDTLASLAEPYGLRAEDIMSINCMTVDDLPPGAQLLLPPDAATRATPDGETPATISDPSTN